MKSFVFIILFLTLILSGLYAQDLKKSDVINLEKREMVSVPGGTFYQENGRTGFDHTVSGFYIAKYEVTYELWYAVRSWALSNGYNFENQGTEGNDGAVGAEPTSAKYEPAASVTWRDAIVWCNAYSEMTGNIPVYMNKTGDTIKDSRNSNGEECDEAIADWTVSGYRLPTEGEWQYSASYIDGTEWTPHNYASGASTFYNDSDDTNPENGVADGEDTNGKVAVYGGSVVNRKWYPTGVEKTAVVGSKMANSLGIYDMSGNVSEWCWDYSDSVKYTENPKTDYRGAESGTFITGHGGSWSGSSSGISIGLRFKTLFTFKEYPDWGFRVSRIP